MHFPPGCCPRENSAAAEHCRPTPPRLLRRFGGPARGTEATFYISKQTGHGTSKEVREKLDAFLKKYGDRGIVSPDHLRFVSRTTRYNRSHWVSFDWLEKHYVRAEIDATRSEGGTRYDIKTSESSE